MSTYVIGDIQGCLASLQRLLDLIRFDPAVDQIWPAGDLVNRGPDTLGTLRFLKNLGNCVKPVLGNHDVNCLSVLERDCVFDAKRHNFESLLTADDREELKTWLGSQPFMRYHAPTASILVHAGIPPQWSFEVAYKYAEALTGAVRQDPRQWGRLMGNAPVHWEESLAEEDKLRYCYMAFTRMRFVRLDTGDLDLEVKAAPNAPPVGLVPWFAHPQRRTAADRIFFGHWSASLGHTGHPNAFALDTGCVWGGKLRAQRLEDGRIFESLCS